MIQNMIPSRYFEHSKELIVSGSKFCGIRSISGDALYELLKTDLQDEVHNKSAEVKLFSINSCDHYFILKKLNWDTDFFQRPMYKILAILYDHDDYDVLTSAVNCFVDSFLRETEKKSYCFLELPSEANILLQALTSSRFKLVETRVHHYLKDIQNFDNKRYMVRKADVRDLENLFLVASNTRNKYDRFHSDTHFSNELADKYLGRFAQETVNGFADMVIVPNEPGIEPNALFAVNLLKNDGAKLGVGIGQLVLAAVDPNTCRGWYEKLLSEICHYVKENGAEYLITNTQATNKAPIHVNEKLGFKYSHTTHILSIANI